MSNKQRVIEIFEVGSKENKNKMYSSVVTNHYQKQKQNCLTDRTVSRFQEILSKIFQIKKENEILTTYLIYYIIWSFGLTERRLSIT